MAAAGARGSGSPAGQEGLSRRLAGELLRAATAAPSMHNTRPWQVRDPRSADEQPQMILRIGYGLPLPPGAPRRPISEILDEPEPDQQP
jgi:hypothetical protein